MAYPFNRLLGCGNLFLFHESLISLHLFYFSIAQITCEHSANTIFIHIHPLSLFGKAVFFEKKKKKKNEAISMKPCTSTYKGDLCHFGVTDGSGIVWQRVDTFQHLDFSTFRFLLLT